MYTRMIYTTYVIYGFFDIHGITAYSILKSNMALVID